MLAFSLVSLVMVARARWRTELSAKARGEPLANMSHEIHTPRNGIPGMTELTLATHLDPEQHEYIRTAQDSGRGLPRNLDLFFQAQEKGLILRGDVDGVPSWVSGDESRLQQILVKRPGNATKLPDSGIGISPAQLTRVFDAFTQADAFTTRRYGGTEPSMGISARLVKSMGGTSKVDSILVQMPLPTVADRTFAAVLMDGREHGGDGRPGRDAADLGTGEGLRSSHPDQGPDALRPRLINYGQSYETVSGVIRCGGDVRRSQQQ